VALSAPDGLSFTVIFTTAVGAVDVVGEGDNVTKGVDEARALALDDCVLTT
jgi:hypothetical protein